MKKKIVVQLSLVSEESRREAMKLAVKVHGVVSATMDKDKGQITLTGENVDPVAVAKTLKGSKLRKLLPCVWPHNGLGHINLVSVEDVKEEEKKTEEKKTEEKKAAEAWAAGYPYWYGGPPVFQVVESSQSGGWWW